MEILKFMFSGFWVFIGFAILIGTVTQTVCFIWKMLLRHLNIRKHGYPPAHCDADGDFKILD